MTVYALSGDELVCHRTAPATVASLLGGITIFTVPPFQRDYAWDENALDLFIGDVDRCRERRLLEAPHGHFFGAIVTTPETRPGTPRPYSMLIDGQQRLATAFLYVTRLRKRFEVAATRADTDELRTAFQTRSAMLQRDFEYVEDLEFRDPKTLYRLNLNRVDDPFFKQLLNGAMTPVPTRTSHRRMILAVQKIESYFDLLLERRQTSEDDDRILTTLYTSFLRDWEVVHISARTRRHANMIYRVLNSRGVPVSDCNLLRAATLERAEVPLSANDLQALTLAWDEILSLEADNPDFYLDIAYQVRHGKRRPTDRTSTNFESSFFPILDHDQPLTPGEAQQLLGDVAILRDDCTRAARMRHGDPARGPDDALSPVMQERLRALTHLFQQDYCLPLLLAASSLPIREFSAVVNILDRFAYRYGVLVRAPIRPFERSIRGYIQSLREDPTAFDLPGLCRTLQHLLDEFASIPVFLQRLKALRYGTGQNAELRYFLAMIEWTNDWYTTGANGEMRIRDETRGIDLANVTLEHIAAARDPATPQELQPLLNTIGNLTLLSGLHNDAAGNSPFAAKASLYERSNFAINRALVTDDKQAWNAADVTARETNFLDRSEKIFSLIRS